MPLAIVSDVRGHLVLLAVFAAACCPTDLGQRSVDLSLDNLSPMQEVLLDYCRDDPFDCEYLCRDLLRSAQPPLESLGPVYECELQRDPEGGEYVHAVYYDGSLC